MMCFGEIVDDNICNRCKPFVLSAYFDPKKENNKASKLIFKEQFMNFWNHSLKTVEETGEMYLVKKNLIFTQR